MSTERRKVLEMLAAGRIRPEEADLLLDRLSASAAREPVPEGGAEGGPAAGKDEERRRPLRFLRVVVDSAGREGIDIRLPLGFIRTGIKLSTLMPGRVSRRLSERGVDLSDLGRLDDESLIAELAAAPIEIVDGDGETIRIFCE